MAFEVLVIVGRDEAIAPAFELLLEWVTRKEVVSIVTTKTLQLTQVGNSTGVVLPRELLEKLRVERGDVLSVVETPDGIELTPYEPHFARQMEIAEQVMLEDRDVLRLLGE